MNHHEIIEQRRPYLEIQETLAHSIATFKHALEEMEVEEKHYEKKKVLKEKLTISLDTMIAALDMFSKLLLQTRSND